MIRAPGVSPALRAFRRTSGFVLCPWADHMERLSRPARIVLEELFATNPYRPVGPWLLEEARRNGPMSDRTFERSLAQLRRWGFLEGEQPPARLLAAWEDAWRGCLRDASRGGRRS